MFISLLVAIVITNYRLNNQFNKIKEYENESIEDIKSKIDSLYIDAINFNKMIYSKIDSINVEEQTIINNYEKVKNAIIDGSMSNDSIASFISNEIHNRRKTLLLLHNR